ncbi:hypothetical protein [Nocardioides sp. CER19]|uniref:hypothetical protein n=1 Tax=Nocardioides sp. CER19 TaxID=3038538 RepID=UPI00244D07E5|nr:hypothetical protein [Nocardioides sp. CER19]MDH2414642.1 hypothetical protein [Nocardioides sp. CER19]
MTAATTWESVLDDLERQVQRAERLIASPEADDLTRWEPPAHLGPLPRHLLARAQSLVERQQTVIDRIPPLLHATRQQHQVGRRIGDATTRPSAPVYVDVTA